MKYFLLLSTLPLFCVSFFVHSAEYFVELSTDIEYSDNIGLNANDGNKESELFQTLALSGGVVEVRKSFQTDASFILEKEHYYGGFYEGETSLRTGLGLLNFDVIEEFLSWHSTFTRRQTLDDSLDADIPSNREHRDIISSGPNLTYNVSSATQLQGQGRYVLVENSQESVSDSKRASLSISASHKVNSITATGLNAQYERVLDQDNGEQKYDRYQLSFDLSRQFVDGSAEISFGRTMLNPDDGEDIASNYASMNIGFESLWLHDVSLSYMEDISDSSIGFDGANPSQNELSADSNDLVKRKYATLEVGRSLGEYRYSVALFWDYDDFETFDSSDEKVVGGNLSIRRSIFSNFFAEARFQAERTEYLGLEEVGEEDVLTYQVMGDYRLSSDVSFEGVLQYETRDNQNDTFRRYNEFSARVGISISLL